MRLLIRLAPGSVQPQLPDEPHYFSEQSVVTIDGHQYLYAYYHGGKYVHSDYDVDAYLASMSPKAIPYVPIKEIAVTGDTVERGKGGIWWLAQNSTFELRGVAALPDSEMIVIIERIIDGEQVIDDIRARAVIADNTITVRGQFSQSGNYIISASRLNKGLESIEAPFRLAFETVEFDAYVA
ncbi:hypothetical protein CWC05_03510 [Pseudoalteromonas ruthenica]|uniref:Uncharacterized protein n=1 Tax=Pseudoalteromonas ruthenica TaxID=151081 RepID=A0A5S3Z8D2_9GAMM|nr:hypothetical protein [Pseudoalteromonas ruthenica]TMP88509.1 hypothetical protein CWC05_03510 [Pseudoalteromonas ruthenica]